MYEILFFIPGPETPWCRPSSDKAGWACSLVHYGRNCLNLFQTTVDADPETPSVPKDWEQDSIYKKIQVDHPPLSKKSSEKINWKLLKRWRKNHYLIQNGSFGGKNSPIIEYWIVLSIMVFDFTQWWLTWQCMSFDSPYSYQFFDILRSLGLRL